MTHAELLNMMLEEAVADVALEKALKAYCDAEMRNNMRANKAHAAEVDALVEATYAVAY